MHKSPVPPLFGLSVAYIFYLFWLNYPNRNINVPLRGKLIRAAKYSLFVTFTRFLINSADKQRMFSSYFLFHMQSSILLIAVIAMRIHCNPLALALLTVPQWLQCATCCLYLMHYIA